MTNLKHVGILGMKWGRRKANNDTSGGTHHQNRIAAQNVKNTSKGNGLLKPTYQYRDSNGNIVSRYGRGKYGGGSKPVSDSKGDAAFKRKVEAMAKKIPSPPTKISMDQTKSFLERKKNKKVATLGQGLVSVGKGVVAVYAAMVVGNFVADKIMWATGAYSNL